MNSNSQEMADAAFTFEAICAAMTRRNVTSAPADLAMRWCMEDATAAAKKVAPQPRPSSVKLRISLARQKIAAVKRRWQLL